MDRKHDVDKRQRLQNRALRLCYNINNPIDIGIVNLHEQTKVDMLCERRKLFLLCLMYEVGLVQHVQEMDMYLKQLCRSMEFTF